MNARKTKSTPASHQKTTGSPEQGEPVFLGIGKLRRAHGLQGEILMDISTHFPERITKGRTLFVGETHQPYEVETIRWANKNLLIKFASIHSPEDIAPLRNQFVYTMAEELPDLPEDEYYHHQLIGLSVVDEQETFLGKIEEILETGANDVYVVKNTAGEEMLLPAIYDVVLSVHLEEGKIIVRLPEFL